MPGTVLVIPVDGFQETRNSPWAPLDSTGDYAESQSNGSQSTSHAKREPGNESMLMSASVTWPDGELTTTVSGGRIASCEAAPPDTGAFNATDKV
jgi:hypothetical protein